MLASPFPAGSKMLTKEDGDAVVFKTNASAEGQKGKVFCFTQFQISYCSSSCCVLHEILHPEIQCHAARAPKCAKADSRFSLTSVISPDSYIYEHMPVFQYTPLLLPAGTLHYNIRFLVKSRHTVAELTEI